MASLAVQGLACVGGIWSCFVFLVQGIGIFQIFRHYSRPPRRAAVEAFADHQAVPHVTVIRPVKGLEPGLYECLASTFRQTYPASRMRIHLCVESRSDPALAVLNRVVAAFPEVEARIYVEAEDPMLHGPQGDVHNLGPNPKIRNISRAYREAPADGVVWIVDCNVWVAPGVAGRMVDKLFGFRAATGTASGAVSGTATTRARPYKFVHQLPLVVDTTAGGGAPWGAALDEMFMATSHAKFYSAINTVGVAPCIVGKSNMFRKAHLDRLTDPAQNTTVLSAADAQRGRGIDFFSSYICEDHLIGDLLWRSPVAPCACADGCINLCASASPQTCAASGLRYRNHGLVAGDLAIQPMADVSVAAYAARRARWLRVRKWTVLLATLVEPGVESLLCAAYAAFALTTLADRLPLPASATAWFVQPTWASMLRCWAVLVALWMAADWCTYRRLQSGASVDCLSGAFSPSPPDDDDATPVFARGRAASGTPGRLPRKPLTTWLTAWLGREVLALPIWTYAVLLGTTVAWRGRPFRVRMDMSVVELDAQGQPVKPHGSRGPSRSVVDSTPTARSTTPNGKARFD